MVLSGFLGLEEVNLLSSEAGRGENMEDILRYLLDNVVRMATDDPLVLFGPKKIFDWGLKGSHRLFASKNKVFRKYIELNIAKVRQKIENESEKPS